MAKLKITRDVTVKECNWLEENFKEGDTVFRYSGCTYGCISFLGTACSKEKGKEPFFEIPTNALIMIEN